jgi:hypothetical protein
VRTKIDGPDDGKSASDPPRLGLSGSKEPG